MECHVAMPQPHLIRLRGPWDYHIADDSAPGGSGRVMLPGDWLANVPASSVRVVFSRRFHRPTGLDQSSQLALCWQDLPGSATILLNGVALEVSGQEIQPLLQSQNLLEILVEADSSRPLLGEVWLAIS